jgi:flagellar basal body-associated protein FliL
MKKKLRKVILAIIALPVLIVVFAVGWSFYWIGKKQHSKKDR